MFFSKKPEILLVGLGNPGTKYQKNRHNIGFMAVDGIFPDALWRLKFQSLCHQNGNVLVLKPQTFMNNSGEAVAEAARFYKIPPERIFVIFDDISFDVGRLRVRESGSAGGHNGIKSIIECLGSEAFPRLKLGVGTKPERWELSNWVLSDFSEEELKSIKQLVPKAERIFRAFAEAGLGRAQQEAGRGETSIL